MRADEITIDIGYKYILLRDGKPVTHYDDYISAKWDMQTMQKSYPNNKYVIRKIECRLLPTTQSLNEKWSDRYKRSINCSNPKGFSQRAHCQGRKKRTVKESESDIEQFKPLLNDFLLFAKQYLGLESLPKRRIRNSINNPEQPTFGTYDNDTGILEIGINNRQPMDILRTVAHELVHYRQHLANNLGSEAGDTGSPQENEANAVAGEIMREYGRLHPELFNEKPIVDETIRRVGSQYRLVSKKTGKNLGTYPTKAQAEKREQQVQFFKHKK